MVINEIDKKIMQLRALSYSQEQIAKQLRISQSAVSQRIHKIRTIACRNKHPENLFWDIMIGDGAMNLIKCALKK
ncbi:hypothetical protein GF358_02855 [Candidatus Woesearchaeota archaeon]|nr:hypothetical protein [Candidatus Woesearchaeota archaeon]